MMSSLSALAATIILAVQIAVPAAKAAPMSWDLKSERTFARLLCADGEYFRECFATSQRTCEQVVKEEARHCDASLSPAKRKALKSEVQLFAEIGVCVGITLEKKWRNQKAATTKCDQKENWQ